jgi:hypothetical protein
VSSPVETWRVSITTDDLEYGQISRMDMAFRQVRGNTRVVTEGSLYFIECEASDRQTALEHVTWALRKVQKECQWLSDDRIGDVVAQGRRS